MYIGNRYASLVHLLGSGLIYIYTGLTNLELIYTLIRIYYNNYNDYSAFSLINTVLNMEGFTTQKLLVAPSLVQEYLAYFSTSAVQDNIILTNDKLKGIGIGMLLIFSGFLFKIAASPFHN